MMGADFNINTERLLLRAYQEQDLDAHVGILSNWDVSRWLSNNIPYPYSKTDGKSFIESAINGFLIGEEMYFSINEKNSSKHIGGIKLFNVNGPICEIGYWVGPEYWYKGYATEILVALISWIKTLNDVKSLVAQTAEKNKGSRKLLEKIGFVHKGNPPEEFARCGHGAGCSEFYILNLNGLSNE